MDDAQQNIPAENWFPAGQSVGLPPGSRIAARGGSIHGGTPRAAKSRRARRLDLQLGLVAENIRVSAFEIADLAFRLLLGNTVAALQGAR